MVGMGKRLRMAVVVVLAFGASACGSSPPQAKPVGPVPVVIEGEPGPASPDPTAATVPPSAPLTSRSASPPPSRSVPTRPAPAPTATPGTLVDVSYRLERRTTDPATAGFDAMAEATLAAPDGWGRAGFRLVRRPSAPFVVVLAEGPEVDRLCLP